MAWSVRLMATSAPTPSREVFPWSGISGIRTTIRRNRVGASLFFAETGRVTTTTDCATGHNDLGPGRGLIHGRATAGTRRQSHDQNHKQAMLHWSRRSLVDGPIETPIANRIVDKDFRFVRLAT